MTGENVRKIREELGLTQRQLCTLLGVTTKTLSTWERLPGDRPVKTVLALALEYLREAKKNRRFRARITGLLQAGSPTSVMS